MTIVSPVYQIAKHESTTDKYTFVSTQRLLEVIEDRTGMREHSCKVTRSVKYRGYQKHIHFLRSPVSELSGDSLPSIYVRNSHRSGSIAIGLGYYRLCCENQLPMTIEGYYFTIKHSKNVWTKVFEVVAKLTEKLNELREMQAQLQRTAVTIDMLCAMRALAIEVRPALAAHKSLSLVAPERVEDHGHDMWTIMNVLQEKIVRGTEGVRSLRSAVRANELSAKFIEGVIELYKKAA